MPAERLHLVRHGEVHNPRRVLYGRLPGFGLSSDGRQMAKQAAEYVHGLERPVSALVASPLQRTRESAEPFIALFGVDPVIDERVIEPTNVFEGRRMKQALATRSIGATCANPTSPVGASRTRASSRAWSLP